MPAEEFKYKSGVSGVVNVPASSAIKQIAATGPSGATAQIGDGDSIDVSLPFSEYPDFALIGPITLTFTNTSTYYISWVEFS